VTILRDIKKETPTVNREITGIKKDRKTMINTMKIKIAAMISVFCSPSSVTVAKSSFKISVPVTYVLRPGVLILFYIF
jgi:hypothetical protein